MKTVKKITALLFVLTLLFTLSATAFATTGTASVQFYVPAGVVTIPSGYSYAGLDSNNTPWFSYSNTANLTAITSCPVTVPSGFQGAVLPGTGYVDTVFDALYYVAVTVKGESVGSEFIYGFDTYNTPNGIYIDTLSGIGTITVSSTYNPSTGHGSWAGYSWNMYVVPSGASFNPLNPNTAYLASLYANNIAAAKGETYYMILEFSSYTF